MTERRSVELAPVILLTGAAGQVGFELTRTLAPLGRVHALDRQSLDLADGDAIRACVRALSPGLIVNAAAYTAVDAAEQDAESCHTVNAIAPGILATEAARVGAAIVHFSTDYVFDGLKPTPYYEDDPTGPLSVYGRTKLEGEQNLAAAGAPWLVLRTGWVYGLRGRNFLRTMLRLFDERDEVAVVDDQFGAPTWSRMIAEATAAIVASGRAPLASLREVVRGVQGVRHLTAAGETSWHGFATAIRELDPARATRRVRTIRAIPTAEYPTAARRPQRSVLDSTSLARRSGVQLPHWRDQLALCLEGV